MTVLFWDVTGSTALGESHGGTVEKFIGDAVMAVFCLPVVHEDDALRAVRGAVEMREALPELRVQARIGLNTGEVVTGTRERLATGEAVNVAARMCLRRPAMGRGEFPGACGARRDRTQLPRDDAYRSRHLLIRDAAYDGLPKAKRAELHERCTQWLGECRPDLVEREGKKHLAMVGQVRERLGGATTRRSGATP